MLVGPVRLYDSMAIDDREASDGPPIIRPLYWPLIVLVQWNIAPMTAP